MLFVYTFWTCNCTVGRFCHICPATVYVCWHFPCADCRGGYAWNFIVYPPPPSLLHYSLGIRGTMAMLHVLIMKQFAAPPPVFPAQTGRKDTIGPIIKQTWQPGNPQHFYEQIWIFLLQGLAKSEWKSGQGPFTVWTRFVNMIFNLEVSTSVFSFRNH